MKLTRSLLAIIVAVLTLGASSASAVELHGYWRSGLGGNSKGGGQTCFGMGQFGYKFRLGNECETYGELEFRQNLYKDRSGIEFNFVSMLAVQDLGQRTYDSLTGASTTSGGATRGNDFPDIALRQIWFGAKLPQLGNATVWAGNRYFHRNDVHIIDFYYWDPSGTGAGIEDINVGLGNLAISVFQSPKTVLGFMPWGDPAATPPSNPEVPWQSPPPYAGTQAKRQIWRPEVRLYDIPAPLGNLEVGLDLFIDWSNTSWLESSRAGAASPNRAKFSPWVTAQHFMPGFLGGFNKLAVQYATGSAAPMNGYPQYDNPSSSDHWRVVEQLVINPMPQLTGMFVFVYEDMNKRYGGTDDYNSARLWTIGGRPEWHINDYFKIPVEIGFQSVDPTGKNNAGDSAPRNLFKATIAPTLVAGTGFFARPELRIFATYADWNTPAQTRNVAGFNSWGTCDPATTTSPWGCQTKGVTFGAQAEAWW